MTKFTSNGREQYTLGIVERWIVGGFGTLIVGGLGTLIAMSIQDHTHTAIMDYRMSQIELILKDWQESRGVYTPKER